MRDVGTAVQQDAVAVRRLAYADPPYPGLARRYYGEHPDYAGEVDHAALLKQLRDFDGWALSTSARALPDVLPLCPRGTRVAAWVRGDRGGHSHGPLNAWEPVLYFGGRRRMSSSATARSVAPGRRDGTVAEYLHDASRTAARDGSRRVDALVHVARPRTTDPARVVGAKPAVFCRWIFDLLGAQPGDELVDIFPGSGGVTRAWETYTATPA